MALKMVSFKFDPQDLEHLDHLANLAGTNRTAFLMTLIRREWDAYEGNPKTKELMDKLTDLRTQMLDLMPDLAALDQTAPSNRD